MADHKVPRSTEIDEELAYILADDNSSAETQEKLLSAWPSDWQPLVQKLVSSVDLEKTTLKQLFELVQQKFSCDISSKKVLVKNWVKSYVESVTSSAQPAQPEKDPTSAPPSPVSSSSDEDNIFKATSPKSKTSRKRKAEAEPEQAKETMYQIKLGNRPQFVHSEIITTGPTAPPKKKEKKLYPLSFAFKDIYDKSEQARKETRERKMVKTTPYTFPVTFYIKQHVLLKPGLSREKRAIVLRQLQNQKPESGLTTACSNMVDLTVNKIYFKLRDKRNSKNLGTSSPVFQPMLEITVNGELMEPDENLPRLLKNAVCSMFQLAGARPPSRLVPKTMLVTCEQLRSSVGSKSKSSAYLTMENWLPLWCNISLNSKSADPHVVLYQDDDVMSIDMDADKAAAMKKKMAELSAERKKMMKQQSVKSRSEDDSDSDSDDSSSEDSS